MSPLRGDYKKEGRKSGMGVGKHKEGCEITREKKKGERRNHRGQGLRLMTKKVRMLGCQGNV